MQVVLNQHEVEQAVQAYLKAHYRIETDQVELEIDDGSVQAFAEYSKVLPAPTTHSAAPKKRRSSAEVQAEREAKAKAKAQAEATKQEEPTEKVVAEVPAEDQVEDEPFGHSTLFPEVAEKAPEEPSSFLDGLEARATHQLFP